MSVNEKMTAIADAIRDKTGETGALTLDDMAADIPKVYDAGKATENRAWWDLITGKNTKFAYDNVFRGSDWTGREFTPPYIIKPETLTYMFASATNLLKVSSDYLDTVNAKGFTYMFAWSSIQELGIIDTRGANTLNRPFYSATKLTTIGKLILKEDGSQTNTNPFYNCSELQGINIEGGIGYSLSFQWCSKLTVASIESIVSALSDTASGQTLTFHNAVKTTYYNAHSSEYADADEAWDALCDTKPSWTIALT